MPPRSSYVGSSKGPRSYGVSSANGEVKTGDAPPAGESRGSWDDECPGAWLWQLADDTAALNSANHLPSDPASKCYETARAQYACGQCYYRCSTGGQLCIDCPAERPPEGRCVVVKTTSACVDGLPASGSAEGTNDWCRG